MGGAMLLSVGPIEAGYFNPGALTHSREPHVFIPMAQISIDSDFRDLADFMMDNKRNFDSIAYRVLWLNDRPAAEAFRDELDSFTGRWCTMNINPMVGVQVGSLSFSAYSVSHMNLKPVIPDRTTAVPYVEAQVAADLVLNGALGIEVGPYFHGGVGVRFMQRRRSDRIFLGSEDMDTPGEFTTGLLNKKNWLDDPPTAFQVDVGGVFTLSRAFTVGGVIRGLVSGANHEFNLPWAPEVSGGVQLKPLELLMGKPLIVIKDITLEADIRNITNVGGEDLVDRLHLGAEVKLPLIALRTGLNRGQLSVGAGLHFLVFDLSVAVSTIAIPEPLLAGRFKQVEKRLFTGAISIGW